MGNLNVLILEDEAIVCIHLMESLKQMGFHNIYKATNYTQAIELASQHVFHIMLSDIRINGDIDGISTAKAVQQLQNSLAIVFITAHYDKETLSRVSEVDFIGYLLKPFRVEELEALITIAINKYDLLDNNYIMSASGEYAFDKRNNLFYYKGIPQILSTKEQLFFALLFNNLNTIVSYAMLDDIMWHGKSVTENTRRNFIYRVKKRFSNLNIQTINNMGIRLNA